MASRLLLVLPMLAALAGTALAEAGAAASRVVLADADPELERALTTALAPWQFEIVIDPAAPANTTQAAARAATRDARFVVWRRGGDLVVFDRERDAAAHRDGQRGALDPASAAAAALTVKTLMRLPPPPPPAPVETYAASAEADHIAVAAAPAGGAALRVQGGLATRVARGSDAEVSVRFVGVALARPWGTRAWRFGAAFDAGSRATVDRNGFAGAASDWSALAVASWTRTAGAWAIEPYAAAGVARAALAGTEMGDQRREAATLPALRAGLWIRRPFGWWSVVASGGVESTPGAPTYTRTNNTQQIYEAPGLGFAIGLGIAAELGP